MATARLLLQPEWVQKASAGGIHLPANHLHYWQTEGDNQSTKLVGVYGILKAHRKGLKLNLSILG